jgi:hypothetical protein
MKNFSRFPFVMTTLLAISLAFGSPATASATAQDTTTADHAVSAAGSWQVSWVGRDGNPKQGSMQIQQNGTSLSGTFQAPRGTTKLSGTLQGSEISLEIKVGKQQFSLRGTVDGAKISGTTGGGKSWSAIRQ